jgi:hypothetical protein
MLSCAGNKDVTKLLRLAMFFVSQHASSGQEETDEALLISGKQFDDKSTTPLQGYI